MTWSIKQPRDWEPYDAEIRSLYLDQNWTLERTMKHMEEKHGLMATLVNHFSSPLSWELAERGLLSRERQYKRHFPRCKNLTRDEWIEVGKMVHKRARDGREETDVFLGARRVDPKRVKRQLERNKVLIARAKTPEIGSSSRISVRTPPSSRQSRGSSMFPDACSDIPWDAYIALSPEGPAFPSPAAFQDGQDLGGILEGTANQLSIPSMALSETDYSDMEKLQRSIWIINLPIERIHYLLQEYGKLVVTSLAGCKKLILQQGHLWIAHDSTIVASDLTVPQSITHSWSPDSLASVLSAVIPQLFDGEFPIRLPGNTEPSILEIAIFAMINNLISNVPNVKRSRLIQWFIEPRHLRLLDSLLKIDVREIVQFGISFLRICLDQLSSDELGAEMRIQLLEIIRTLVISRLSASSLPRTEATLSLNTVARYDCPELVQFLINIGADVDHRNNENETTLMRAVRGRNQAIVRCLLDNGAEVNDKWWSVVHDTRPLTALGHCLEDDACLDDNSIERNAISLILINYGADINDRAFAHGGTTTEWSAFKCPHLYDIISRRWPNTDQSEVAIIGRTAHEGREAITKLRRERSWSAQALEKALIDAVKFKSTEVVEVLLNAGVDPDCSALRERGCGSTRYERSPLSEALCRQDEETVDLLLDFGATVTSDDMNVLWWQRLRGYDGGNPFSGGILWCLATHTTRRHGRELLLLATFTREKALIEALLDNIGADPRVPPRTIITIEGDFQVCTPLQVALLGRSASWTKYIWSRGCRFSRNAIYSDGWYELELACTAISLGRGMTDIIKTFLDNGASPNRRMAEGDTDRNEDTAHIQNDTALHALFRSGLDRDKETWIAAEVLEVSKMLIAKGADVNRVALAKHDFTYSTRDGSAIVYIPLCGSPIQMACECGLLDVVQLLLSHGADIRAPAMPSQGRSALQAACYSRTSSLEVVQYLLENGVDVNEEPSQEYGVTALQGAAIRGHMEIALKLLAAGAEVNAPSAAKEGRTAIEGAAEHGRLDMAKLLINAGAVGDVTRQDRFHTAIDLAEKEGHYHIASLLREHQ